MFGEFLCINFTILMDRSFNFWELYFFTWARIFFSPDTKIRWFFLIDFLFIYFCTFQVNTFFYIKFSKIYYPPPPHKLNNTFLKTKVTLVKFCFFFTDIKWQKQPSLKQRDCSENRVQYHRSLVVMFIKYTKWGKSLHLVCFYTHFDFVKLFQSDFYQMFERWCFCLIDEVYWGF